MNLFKCMVILSGLLLTLAVPLSAQAQTTDIVDDGTILKEILIFGRHGIRAPTAGQSTLDQYSAAIDPFPPFNDGDGIPIPTGYLTPNGQTAAALLGTYFNAYLLNQKLLTGVPQTDLAKSYFRANSIQRSNVTCDKFGVGLIYGGAPPQGATVPVHSFDLAENGAPPVTDPVIDPILARVAAVDAARAVNEANGIFGSAAALASSYSDELSLVSSVLYPSGAQPIFPPGTIPTPGAPPSPPGSYDPTSIPFTLAATPVGPGLPPYYTGNVIDMGGLSLTTTANDPFVMQYADNFPLNDVAWGLWGQTPLPALSQQTRLNVLQISIAMRTPYLNRVQSSNLASHLLHTMELAVNGGNLAGPGGPIPINDCLPGAFGNAKSRIHVITSSDYYVSGLAGLLQAHWLLPGYQPDFVGPGGALVFELRQVKRTKAYIVRVYFTGQTLDQLRGLTPLDLQNPPATMQLFIPGGSKSATNLDVNFTAFQTLLRNAIGPQYVQNPAEPPLPPPVLTGVPSF